MCIRDRYRNTDPLTEQRSDAAAKVLRSEPVKPGDFKYSNLGYCIAGAAIDRLAGRSYEDALEDLVLSPLSVTSADFGAPGGVQGHHRQFGLGMLRIGKVTPVDANHRFPADNPPLFNSAGRIHLSIPDWATIMRVFLNDGAPLVSVETIDHLLFDPDPGAERGSMAMGWSTVDASLGRYGMQGSNTMWGATAVLDRQRHRAALTVTNDGRMGVVEQTAYLAQELLRSTIDRS